METKKNNLHTFIYFVKNFRKDDTLKVLMYNDNKEKKKVKDYIAKAMKYINSVEDWQEGLKEIEKKLNKFTQFPFKTAMVTKVKNEKELQEFLERFANLYYVEADIYSYNEWWLYTYLQNRLDSYKTCFLSVEDLKLILDYNYKKFKTTHKHSLEHHNFGLSVKKLKRLIRIYKENKDSVIVKFFTEK